MGISLLPFSSVCRPVYNNEIFCSLLVYISSWFNWEFTPRLVARWILPACLPYGSPETWTMRATPPTSTWGVGMPDSSPGLDHNVGRDDKYDSQDMISTPGSIGQLRSSDHNLDFPPCHSNFFNSFLLIFPLIVFGKNCASTN